MVSIKNKHVFGIVVEQVLYGLSFRNVTLTLRNLRLSCGLGFLSSVNEQSVAHYVQTLCLLNIHALPFILSSEEVWDYSVAVNRATHKGTEYLDIRVSAVYRGILRSFHILAVLF